jgi:uncharacterized protein YaaR (DUF327 family)
MQDNNGNKYLTVEELKKSLDTLPLNDRLMPNDVHNLSILDAEGEYRGFIDFLLNGKIELGE